MDHAIIFQLDESEYAVLRRLKMMIQTRQQVIPH